MDRKIRILFAPGNTASMPDITLQALNKLSTCECRGISFGANQYWSFGKGWTIVPITSFRINPVKRLFQTITFKTKLLKRIIWADILMWHWDISWFEYYVVKLLRKPIFIEWIGSDIRIPEVLFKENSYYKQAWENGDWDYKIESKTRSEKIQQKFCHLKAKPLLCPEMSLFLNRNLFPEFIPFMQRIDIGNYKAAFPKADCTCPKVIHTPSATGTKGTKYVRAAIEQMKAQGLNFEYIEIHNKTRQEALAAIESADIFIDQFIGGSYGLATCEAMAMGKPVLCYLMPFVTERLPADCPILNTSIETLNINLGKLLANGTLRTETGKKSRAYAEKYHDADKIALQLEKLYKETLYRN